MPLNGRQMTSLITLSGGSNIAPAGDFTGSKYSYQTISVSIAGGNGNTTLWRLDGGDNQDYMGNGNLPFPFPDAVSQFSVESTDSARRMANTWAAWSTSLLAREPTLITARHLSSSATTISTPLTSSQRHPTRFTRISTAARSAVPSYAISFFAFAAYQRTQGRPVSSQHAGPVPTAQNLAGDFSTTDGAPGVPGSNACNSTQCVQLGRPPHRHEIDRKQICDCAHIQRARQLALMGYLPGLNPADQCGFVSYAIPYKQTDNQFVTRVDYTINPKNNLYGRYFIDGYQFPAYFSRTNILITTQSGNIERVRPSRSARRIPSAPNLVNSAHASILRRVTTAVTPRTTSTQQLWASISTRPFPTDCRCPRANSPSAAAPTPSPISTTTPSP
jgi:hypothetical protein